MKLTPWRLGGVTRLLAVVTLLVGLLIPTTVFAEEVVPPEPETPSSIEGTVSSDAGAPISGIVVTLLEGGPENISVTSPSGEFGFADVTAGTYALSFVDPAGEYETVYSGAIEVASDSPGAFHAQLVATTAIAEPLGPDADADPAPADTESEARPAEPTATAATEASEAVGTGSIIGLVADGSGTPISGVEVSAYGDEDTDWSFNFGYTDDAGGYELGGLQAGEYELVFHAPDLIFAAQSFTGVEVVDDEPTTVDATLIEGGSISGVVTNGDGAPLAGVAVNAGLMADEGWDYGWATTDESGFYEIRGLTPGDYGVDLDAVDQPFVRQTLTASGVAVGETVVLNAVLADGGSIAGQVTNTAGEPIEGVDVYADGYDGDVWDYGWASTDEGGRYQFIGLAPGTYDLSFEAYDLPYGTAQLAGIPVVVGETTIADVTLADGGSIAGTVSGPDGEPIRGAYVGASSVDEDNSYDYGYAETDETGGYEIIGLNPGTYTVRIQAVGTPFAPITFERVIVVAGETTDLSTELEPGGQINGRVTDSSQNPIADVDVTARGLADTGWDESTGYTDEDGYYELIGLTPGGYELVVDPYELPFGNAYVTGIDVAVGSPREVNLTLQAAGSITGRVTDRGGDPIAGIEVFADGWEDSLWDYGWTETDEDGWYEIEFLTAGTYTVNAWANDGNWVGEPQTGIVVDSGSQTSDVDFELFKSAKISGVYSGGVGNDWASLLVTLVDAETCTDEVSGSEADPSSGEFTISSVPPGTYKVAFSRILTLTTVAEQFYGGAAGDCAGATVFEVGESETIDLDPVSVDIGGSAVGSLLDAHGEPVVADAVVAVTPDGALAGREGEITEDGSFSIGGLATREYLVQFEFYPDLDFDPDSEEVSELERADGIAPGTYYFTGGEGNIASVDVDDATTIATAVGESLDVGITVIDTGGSTGPIDPIEPIADIRVPAAAYPGEVIDIHVGIDFAGELVDVFLYSSPIYLGDFEVGQTGYVTVLIPEDVGLGEHQLVVFLGDVYLGSAPITILRGDQAPGAPVDDSTSGSTGGGTKPAPGKAIPVDDLPETGGDEMIVLFGGVFLLLMGGFMLAGRSGRLASVGRSNSNRG